MNTRIDNNSGKMRVSGSLEITAPDTGQKFSLSIDVEATPIEPVNITHDYGISEVFVCSAMAKTLSVNNGNPITAGDGPVPISIDNIGHDGKYQGTIDGGLKASIGGTPKFVGDSGGWPTNNYLWTPPDNLDKDTQVIFEYSGCTFQGPVIKAKRKSRPAQRPGKRRATPQKPSLRLPKPDTTPVKSLKGSPHPVPKAVGDSLVTEGGFTIRRIADARGPYSTHTVEAGAGDDPIVLASDGSVFLHSANTRVGKVGGNKRRPAWLEDNSVYYIDETELRKYVHGGDDTLVHDFRENGIRQRLDFGEAEGNFDIGQDVVCLTEGSKHSVVHHMYSVKRGYIGRKTTASILEDAQNFRYKGAGLQESVAGGRIDNACVCKRGRYVVAFVKNAKDEGVCYVRYNLDWSNPVVIGTYGDDKFWKLRAQHKDFFVGMSGESMMISDHWADAFVVDLDEPHKVYRIECKGGGHYCGNAILRPGHVLYSDNASGGLMQMLRFDKHDYAGSVEVTGKKDKGTIGYWHEPTREVTRETWGFSGFKSSQPGTLAACNQRGDRVYYNVGDKDSQVFCCVMRSD